MNRSNEPVFDPSRTSSSLAGRRAPDSSERRGGGRVTMIIAWLALATALYSLARLDGTRDRVEHVKDFVRSLETAQVAMRSDIATLTKNEQAGREAIQAQLRSLSPVPDQVRDLTSSIEELRGHAEGPQRAWSRAEALFLLELAQRRLGLDRDVATARSALDAADARLAMLREPALTAVREQIAREQRALAESREPDRSALLVQLAAAEDQVGRAAIKGVLADNSMAVARESLPDGVLARAWAVTARTFGSLFTVQPVRGQAGSIVTTEENLLRRQHLQLLMFSARVAVIRHDNEAYRAALGGATRWLEQYFDTSDAATMTLRKQIEALLAVNVDPALPDISRSSQLLQRQSTPVERGKS